MDFYLGVGVSVVSFFIGLLVGREYYPKVYVVYYRLKPNEALPEENTNASS